MNALQQLNQHGQSVWLDHTRRSFVASGALRKLVDEDGVTGVTSNPAIFEQAIREGDDYDDAVRQAAGRGLSPGEIFEEIAVADIQGVADVLRPVFDRTRGRDGFVSIEVSPHLARDAAATLEQAREFRARIDRPNLCVKIPATAEGLRAIRGGVAEGINVNVTLIFGLPRYREVAEAYLAGLEDRLARGGALDGITSVASFFLSRVDVAVDARLDEVAAREPELAGPARALRGRVAVAGARQAYQVYKDIIAGARFRRLAEAGARPQRLLWASTATKRPEERDVRYVEALVGRDTINTMPLQTLEAFRDHGDPTPSLEAGLDDARATLRALGELGISLEAVARELEGEGLGKFVHAFDQLHDGLRRKVAAAGPAVADRPRR